MTGSAAGTLLLNLALGKMNDSLGWRMSWRILSAFTAGSCVCGCAFLQPLDVGSASRQWNQFEKVSKRDYNSRKRFTIQKPQPPKIRVGPGGSGIPI